MPQTNDAPAAPGRVGFLGLGRMGGAMAARLIDAGHEVVVWNRSPAGRDVAVRRGAIEADSPAEVASTGTVFSMLANEEVIRQLFSTEALRAAPAAFVHVNHATISPSAARELAALHEEHGHAYVAAPVIGRPHVADLGQLTILAAGDSAAVDAVRPYLAAMGKRVWECGSEPANANLTKIAVNYLIIHALQALAESLSLLEAYDLDTRTFIDAINDSIFPGAVYEGYGKAIAAQQYLPPGFTTTLGFKDLNLAISAAERAGVRLPSSDVLRSAFESAIAAGLGDLDWASIAEGTRQQLH